MADHCPPPVQLPAQVLSRVSDFIDRTLGLYYPERRFRDLERGLQAACDVLGHGDVEACARWLAEGAVSDAELRLLAGHLTTGETYFFREMKTLEVLRTSVLPKLIARRVEGERTLRLWSAGCCTGEEAYTLAIMLHRLLPAIRSWKVSVLATDVNQEYLDRAERGVYREWSFRGAPRWLRADYFKQLADGSFEIAPYVRDIVHFRQHNLRTGDYPSPATDTGGMDVILCRNVFIYFSPENVRAIAERFKQCLRPDGWLVTSPTEGAVLLDMGVLEPVHFPEALLFRNSHEQRTGPACPFGEDFIPDALRREAAMQAPAPTYGSAVEAPDVETSLRLLAAMGARAEAARPEALSEPLAEQPGGSSGEDAPTDRRSATAVLEKASRACEAGRYREALRMLEEDEACASDHAAALLATCHANLGDLDAASDWCARAVEAARLDPCVHYLRATVCQERGEVDEARSSLERAVYLDQEFVMAHFLLGNLERAQGEAHWRRRFKAGLALLEGREPDETVPHSDGMSAGRLAQIMRGVLEA